MTPESAASGPIRDGGRIRRGEAKSNQAIRDPAWNIGTRLARPGERKVRAGRLAAEPVQP